MYKTIEINVSDQYCILCWIDISYCHSNLKLNSIKQESSLIC